MHQMLTIFLAVSSLITLACNGGQEADSVSTNGEMEAEACLSSWMRTSNVDESELRKSMENYFVDNGLISNDIPKSSQYKQILGFIAQPTQRFPPFSDKQNIVDITKKLELSSQEIMAKKQLDCFRSAFKTHWNPSDTTSAFYAWGDVLETLDQVPNVSPGVVASALSLYMTEADLNKPLYQTAIALMFYLDFTLFLNE